ncbi:vesicle-associated membrane protein 4-like [Neoarius graeffei]|uniref:vesicle-associated membrane protein 4-like n=1 Tax=Neoarius graeffei TaxID=443677 RepID=UPI00298CCFC8|nr:vesicle-associated membrane protein 4-like [Neoarius graeffei]
MLRHETQQAVLIPTRINVIRLSEKKGKKGRGNKMKESNCLLISFPRKKKGESQLQQVQENVEEVQTIMQENFTRVGEREGKLEELDDRAEILLKKSKQFEKTTRKVAEKMETENTCLRCKKWQRIMAEDHGRGS